VLAIDRIFGYASPMSYIKERIKELVTPEHHTPGNKEASVVAVCSQKGGVGKTTTAVNLGAGLAHFYNKKVLVIDLDPQGHVEKSLGSMIPEGIEYNPLSSLLMERKADIMDGIIRTEQEGFYLTPGDKYLAETENLLSTKIGKEFIIQNSIKTAKTHFDYILFDCPPAMGNLTVNALVASDYVVIPCEMSVLAFEGVNDLLETLDTVNERLNHELNVLGVLFTRVDRRNIQMNQLVHENMRKYFNGKIFKSQISINTDLNKAQLDGRPIFLFAKTSSGAANYGAMTKEFVEKLERNRVPRVA
jgi:chromosome partitioning protein